MLAFCWRTLSGCVRSLVRLSLELSSLVLVRRLRLGWGSTLIFFWLEVGTSSSLSSCTGRLSSSVVVGLRLRVGVTVSLGCAESNPRTCKPRKIMSQNEDKNCQFYWRSQCRRAPHGMRASSSHQYQCSAGADTYATYDIVAAIVLISIWL